MKSSKTIYFILFLILLLLIILFFQIFKKSTPNPIVTPSLQPDQNQKLTIISTNFDNNQRDVVEPIKIVFSQPILKESIKIDVIPDVKLKLELNPNATELNIIPVEIFKYGSQYTIKIIRALSSNKSNLDKTYEFTFKTRPYSGI